jgi:hypothetical protein
MSQFYVIAGIAALLLAVAVSRLPRWAKLAVPVLLAVGFGLLGPELLRPTTFRGGEVVWYRQTPWKHLLLFGAMLLGMVSNTLFDYLDARIKARKAGRHSMPKLHWEEMLLPLVVAGVVFGYFWGKHSGEEMGLAPLLLSFQNGFFWQSVLDKVRSRDRHSHRRMPTEQ